MSEKLAYSTNNLKFLPSFTKRSRLATKRKIHSMEDVLLKHTFSLAKLSDLTSIEPCPNISFELGFGNGVSLIQRAIQNPKEFFIGCEVYLAGITQLLSEIVQHNLSNIMIYRGDGRIPLAQLPNNILANFYLAFADPWPKKKHHKKRIVNEDFISSIICKLRPQGKFIACTDHTEYANWIAKRIPDATHSNYAPTDWIETKYEKKARQQKAIIHYFTYCKP